MSERKEVTTNFLWRFFERIGAEGVNFIVSIFLARLLLPEQFGKVALISVFTGILNVFVDSGMCTALVQKKDADDLDFSSVFYFNMASCILLYLVMFFSAPMIAKFYKSSEFIPYIRVQSLTLIISGVKGAQQAYVSKNMLFRRFFFATLGGTIGAAGIGIVMAIKGFGVWAIIAQNLFNQVVDTCVLWITVKWRPKLMFSFRRLKGLLFYGFKILISSLLDKAYSSLNQLIIGVKFSSEDLAFYNKGNTFPGLVTSNINTSMNSVLLPVMSKIQDDSSRVKEMTRRAIKTSAYLMAPLMVGLAVCAKPMIRLLLTDNWLPCVPYLYIFCLSYLLYPIHTANLNAIKAMGRSDIFLRLEIIKKIIGLAAVASTMWFGVMPMALSLIPVGILSQFINAWPNKKLLNYNYFDQLKDVIPGVCMALAMGIIVYGVNFLHLNDLITLIIQVPLGAVIYIGMSYLLKVESFYYVLSIVEDILHIGKNKKGQ